MARRTFTDRWLRTAGPFEQTKEFVDQACPNLWVRIGKNRKTFSVLIGSAASRRRIAIGQYPGTSLVDARKKATDLIADPRAAGGGEPRPGGGRQRNGTVRELFEFVIAAMEAEGKTASIPDYRIYLLDGADAAVADFGPATPATNVTPAMITDWLAKFHERGSSTRLPRAILSAAFNRGLKADNDPTTSKDRKILFALETNPVASVGGPTQSQTRDRSLSMEELAQFWRDLAKEPFAGVIGIALRLIIAMGGVRVTEVLRSEKDWWIDDGGWRLLKAPKLALPKTKNGHPHDLPVTQVGARILEGARKMSAPESRFLFPSPYGEDAPRTLDNLSKNVRLYCLEGGIEPFTPRDLRRTMKNLLLDADVPQSEVDIWHNHGRNADVARRNYDRAQYEHAKGRVRDAIDEIIGVF